MQTARPGPLNRKIPVQTNDRTTPQLMLDCNVNVLAALKVEPINVAFGAIERTAGPQSRTLTLTRGDGGPVAPRVLSTGNPRVTAEITEITTGERYALVVTAAPPWPNGPLTAAIQLDTGVPEGPREIISVFGSVPPRLTALPNQFAFTGAIEKDTEASIRLRWAGGPPGRVVETTTNIKDASVTFTPGGENIDPVVTLKLPAGCAPDLRTGYFVTVKTDDAEAGMLQVPVLFRRVGAPQPDLPVGRAPGTKPLRPPGTSAAGNPTSAGPTRP